MALGTALGSLPLLGLMIPLLYPHGPDEVTVVLKQTPKPDSPAPAAKDP